MMMLIMMLIMMMLIMMMLIMMLTAVHVQVLAAEAGGVEQGLRASLKMDLWCMGRLFYELLAGC
eukprot:948502-Rhodomonas_salina.1